MRQKMFLSALNGISIFYSWSVHCVLKFQFVQAEGIVRFLTFFYSMIQLD